MAECPQFQLMPQVMPIYRPQMSQPPPPPPPSTFPMAGQHVFPMPPHFGYPPLAWSPVLPYSPPPPTVFRAEDEDNSYASGTTVPAVAFNNNNSCSSNSSFNYNNNINVNNNPYADDSQQIQRPPLRQNLHIRNVSNKFDTRHEEFRKYLEEIGILSSFTNILCDMYQDPLRPNDPLEYIRDKLCCSRPETIELSNLRLWCKEYQNKIAHLEKELQHVIERLRKHEPYITDDSLFNANSRENECKSCELNVAKQGHILGNIGLKDENVRYEQITNNNQ